MARTGKRRAGIKRSNIDAFWPEYAKDLWRGAFLILEDTNNRQ